MLRTVKEIRAKIKELESDPSMAEPISFNYDAVALQQTAIASEINALQWALNDKRYSINKKGIGMVIAPFTPEQVGHLNDFQKDRRFHPFTCANRGDDKHRNYATAHGERDHGILVATEAGWICPCCDYTQNWAHYFMTEKLP